MAVDLVALQGQCRAETGNEEDAAAVFGSLVERLAGEDLCAYGLWVHGRHPTLRSLAMSRHVRLWAELLERNPQLLLICPPEHGKSTVMQWHIEQWIGRETERAYGNSPGTSRTFGTTRSDGSSGTGRGTRPASPSTPTVGTPTRQSSTTAEDPVRAPSALLVMNTATQAEKRCMAVAATLEANQRYKRLYPHVKPAPKWGWTKTELYCHRPSEGTAQPDPTLQATGMFGPIQGARVGLCVVDDPTDQQDSRSDKILDAQKEWHQGTLDDRVLEGGLRRDILTRWSKRDIAQMLMDSGTWAYAVLPALNQLARDLQPPIWEGAYPEYPWGKALWPEVWPEDRLEKKRKEKMLVRDSGLWQLAYQANPVAAGGNLFKRTWFQYGEPSVPWAREGATA